MTALRLVVVLLTCTLAGPVAAQPVRDEAGLFQPETVAEARDRIEQIHRDHGKQVLIETFPALSRVRSDGYNLKDPGHLDEIFTRWASDRCKSVGLDGVYILVCKEPRYVLVMVWPEANASLVTQENQQRIRAGLASSLGWDPSFRETLRRIRLKPRQRPRADEGLLYALWLVDKKMEWHRPVDWATWTSALSVIGGALAAWFVLGVIRNKLRLRAIRQGLLEPEQCNAPAGTPWAVLGGGMGTVVGQWLLDWLHGKPAPVPLTRVDSAGATRTV